MSLIELAWEPSAAQVTKSFSRRLPPLERFSLETKYFKVYSLTLESQIHELRTFLRVSIVL